MKILFELSIFLNNSAPSPIRIYRIPCNYLITV